MCVWITAESVFQCLGTDTFCPPSALSLVPGNMLGDNTLDDTRKFSANVLSCFNCVNCASMQLSSFLCDFVVWTLQNGELRVPRAISQTVVEFLLGL